MAGSNIQDATGFLSHLVGIASVNGTPGEKVIAKAIVDWYGQGASLAEVDENRANVVIRLKGKNHGHVTLFNGHLDTVPFGDTANWETPPGTPTVREGRLYGRGSSDMKGGLAAALFSLKTLAGEGFVPEHDILYIATCDEETGGAGAAHALETGLLEGVCQIIIGEPTGNRLSVASKGTLWLHLDVGGKTAHGAYPQQGVNAVEVVHALYGMLKGELSRHRHPHLGTSTCALTKISGGIKENMIPDHCTATLDIRTVPAYDNRAVLDHLQECCHRLCGEFPGSTVHVTVANNRMPVEIAQDHPLVLQMYDVLLQETGALPPLTGTSFFSDASVFLREGYIPTLLFGPGESSMAHQNNEYIELSHYLQSVSCYRALMQQL